MPLVTISTSFASESLQFGVVHYQSRWQVATAASFAPETILEDTWYVSTNLSTFSFDIPIDGTARHFRMQTRDNYGMISAWSDPISVSFGEMRRTLEKAWAFVLDGHVFYVLNMTLEPALIYDITTQQWCRWYKNESLDPESEPFWNMFRGMVWKGRVLAADYQTAQIWELDPNSMLDEGVLPIRRVVTGYQPLRGSASVRQGALRVIARKEDAEQIATLTMRFSNDGGNTWSTDRIVELAANSYSQRLEFRSLGRIRAPGRLWEIEDSGGFVRIDGADADIEGAE